MNEHEKQDEDVAQPLREGPMTEMEAAARILALRDRLHAEKVSLPHSTPRTYKDSDLPALQEFAETAKREGPKEPPNRSWRFPVGSPNTLSQSKTSKD